MPQVDPQLKQQASAQPDETFRVIVRVHDDMDARQAQLEAEGFQIVRRMRLIRGFAATARGECVSKVMNQDWIVSIEQDREVHTMGGN